MGDIVSIKCSYDYHLETSWHSVRPDDQALHDGNILWVSAFMLIFFCVWKLIERRNFWKAQGCRMQPFQSQRLSTCLGSKVALLPGDDQFSTGGRRPVLSSNT